jgi:prepilin-type processing-associated H-X9-DG protein/prepilin-type N-terminal cleavage/methylation domain-containing protein
MRRRGFTFIELLTVWAIIMVLAAILFPVFAKARAKARQVNCLRNQLNIGIALKAYAADRYGHFPPATNDLSPLVPNCLPDPAAFLCPDVPREPTPEPAPVYETDFVYQGGLCDDDKPNTMILADDDGLRHNGGANYLFLDGHAKWLKDPWKARTVIEGADEILGLQKPRPDYLEDVSDDAPRL